LTPQQREIGLFDIVGKISPPKDLEGDTDQATAFNWLVNIDPAQVCPDQVLDVQQRYILALVYFATNGDNWLRCNSADAPTVRPCAGNMTRYLSESNVCAWFMNQCSGETLTQVRIGKFRKYKYASSSI
jgi:hypothetical protein